MFNSCVPVPEALFSIPEQNAKVTNIISYMVEFYIALRKKIQPEQKLLYSYNFIHNSIRRTIPRDQRERDMYLTPKGSYMPEGLL